MKKFIKIILGISFVIYIFGLAGILFLKSRGFLWHDMSLLRYIKYSSNIIPFKTISTYFRAIFDGSMNMDIPIKNLLGNFILFMPMGIYLPLLFKKVDKVSILYMCMTLLLFSIECIQVVTRRGSFDIDDYILNILGALVGYGIWKTRVVQQLLREKMKYQLPY